MYKTKFFVSFFIVLLLSFEAFSNVYDNRYLPLYKRPFTKEAEQKYSRFGAGLFVASADSAMSMHGEDVMIPKLFGDYNMENIGKALVTLGRPNPLPYEFQSISLPWDISQNINAQGVSLLYDQHIYKYLYFGASLMFMRVCSNFSFIFNKGESGLNRTGSGYSDIYDYLYKMNCAVGAVSNSFNKFGMGDMDAYIRIGNIWDYLYKMQRIDAGFRLGVLIPTGVERYLDMPSSIPFGGNGHWGIYGEIDTELGLKDDMRLLLMLRLSKRFSQIRDQRLPVAQEDPLYAPLIAPVKVDPGYTVVFAPQFWWQNLRAGFGLRVGYTMVYNSGDCWTDCRSEIERENVPADIGLANCCASWGNDYLNLSGYYQFFDEVDNKRFSPTISLNWDWPVFFFVGKCSAKTQCVSLGLDVIF